MKSKKAVINKIALALTLFVCLFAAMGSTGCSPRCIVTVHNRHLKTCYIFTPKKGETITVEMIVRKYPDDYNPNALGRGYLDENLYIDYDCLTKFVGGVKGDTTLYFSEYPTYSCGKIIFEYKNKEYTVFRLKGETLTAEDFSRSAYGYGKPEDYSFFSDKEHTEPLDIQSVEVPKDRDSEAIKIYVAGAK